MPRLLSRQKSRRDTNKMTIKSKSVDEEMTPDQKISFLMKQNDELQKKYKVLIENKKEEKTEAKPIAPNEFVKVMSLCANKLNLATRPHGQGKTFSFDRFGETKNILYSDLLEINNNQKNFLEAGYYYILDDRVIDFEGLNDIYDKILSKEQIERILSNEKDASELFQKANPKQQTVIVKFIVDKIITGEDVDFNLINALSKVSKIDIQARVKSAQNVIEIIKEENK
jgi:hypothetical protein